MAERKTASSNVVYGQGDAADFDPRIITGKPVYDEHTMS